MVALTDPTTLIFIRVQSAFVSGQIYYQIPHFSRYQNSLNLTPLPYPPPRSITLPSLPPLGLVRQPES